MKKDNSFMVCEHFTFLELHTINLSSLGFHPTGLHTLNLLSTRILPTGLHTLNLLSEWVKYTARRISRRWTVLERTAHWRDNSLAEVDYAPIITTNYFSPPIKNEKFPMFLRAMQVPRAMARSGSSAMCTGRPDFFERR